MNFKIILLSLYIIAFLTFTSCTVNVNQSFTNENLNANAAISQNETVLDINENPVYQFIKKDLEKSVK